MEISYDSQIKLSQIAIHIDKKNSIVENSDTGEYFEIPEPGIIAIEGLQSNMDLKELEASLKKRFPEEDIDLLDFIDQLLELGLVSEVDGVEVADRAVSGSSDKFSWLPARAGKFFFNRISTRVYMLLFFFNIIIFSIKPELFPNYKDIFLFDSLMLNILLMMGLSLLLIVVHELGHVLAVRSYGLPTSLGISHRLFLVVFETDMTHAWRLPARERNVLYLAGMCFDNVVLFVALIAQIAFPEASSLFPGILAIAVLDIVIKMIYQCCFYMKTDLYYVFENTTGCYNLMENSKVYLRKWLPFLPAEKHTEMFEGEVKIVRLYSIFYLTGVLLTLGVFIGYGIPQMVYAYSQLLPNLLRPVSDPYFWDSFAVLFQILIVLSLLLYSWTRKYKQRAHS
ncbi:peptidase [Pseudalkalibacillus caeni]|uniref:Peptidase n=1 Tax=Exobacillus caeni TaxID=2574798 RepID=A0A5R9FFB5_9BACL|nr:peptidase [Pseudalkalibacillus caeni]TLS38265.1 peptidase [Pseudalkalibacillus caeni]